jgi:hypothetical protein
MRSVSGEFETSPWGEIPNWGRCVPVASAADVDAVHRLVAASGNDRRAVVFEWQTHAGRQTLIDELEAAGFTLRAFDDTDRSVSSLRPTGMERLLMLPGLAYVLAMRMRGRTTEMYEVTTTRESLRHR